MPRRCQSKCALVRIPPKQMEFPWPDSQGLTLGVQSFRVPCPPRGRQGSLSGSLKLGVLGAVGLLSVLLPRSFQGLRLLWTIDLRLTHWTASSLHVTLGRSSSPGSWAAAKASRRESPWNLLLMFMQWPVWSRTQCGYCSAFQGCQLVAGVKMCPGLGWRIPSAYHCTRFWKKVQTVSAGRGWGWNRLGQPLRLGPRWTPQESHVAHSYFPESHLFQLFKHLFSIHIEWMKYFLVLSSMRFGKCAESCNHRDKDTVRFCRPWILSCCCLIDPPSLNPWRPLICFSSLEFCLFQNAL